MSQYEKFFREADTDKSGFITLAELTAVLKKYGYSDQKIQDTFATIDYSGDNKISMDEFLSSMGQRSPKEHKAAEYRSVFRSFDKNGDGTITSAELGEALKKLGMSTSDAEVKRIMAKVDKDGSGTITYEEFIKEFFGKDA